MIKDSLLREIQKNDSNNDNIYFDIDLDYFTESDLSSGGGNEVALRLDDIVNIISPTTELMQYLFQRMEGMTIATEPKWCGGIRNSNQIFEVLDETLFDHQLLSKNTKWKHLSN